MSVLNRLASSLGRRDDAPNKQLAKELAAAKSGEEIRELVANLNNPDPRIQSDCIKVLYEIGYIDPELISGYVREFLKLLQSGNNRMVWGGMCALATIAHLQADVLYEHREEIKAAIEAGSVITVDRGIKALSAVAAQNRTYRSALLPYLLAHLEACRPRDLPHRAEVVLEAVDKANKEKFVDIVRKRMAELRPSQVKRLQEVIARAERR